MECGYHVPVMLAEVVAGLDIREGGLYCDLTVGGGGHSYAILSSAKTNRLIAIDKDGDALEEAERRLAPFAGRVSFYRSDFKDFPEVLAEAGADKLDGALLDLGVSSHQLNSSSRGFGYLHAEAPLDMRMDRRQALTAKDVVNGYSEEALRRILKEYGEEPFAAAIARRIAAERAKRPIETCGQLRSLVEESIPPKFRSAACAGQTFQAIRIEVNGELDGLENCITGLVRRLAPDGRICILTFHSLEDRIVKQTFRKLASDCECPKNFPVCVCGKKREIEILTPKPITASENEIKDNSRSKCAKLRIARKIGMNGADREYNLRR